MPAPHAPSPAGFELPIDLNELPASTRSWMISKSAAGRIDPATLAHDVLVQAAEDDGFFDNRVPAAPPMGTVLLNSSPSPEAPDTPPAQG